jgi:hypothetical protein
MSRIIKAIGATPAFTGLLVGFVLTVHALPQLA